jgi:hypothetical protein
MHATCTRAFPICLRQNTSVLSRGQVTLALRVSLLLMQGVWAWIDDDQSLMTQFASSKLPHCIGAYVLGLVVAIIALALGELCDLVAQGTSVAQQQLEQLLSSQLSALPRTTPIAIHWCHPMCILPHKPKPTDYPLRTPRRQTDCTMLMLGCMLLDRPHAACCEPPPHGWTTCAVPKAADTRRQPTLCSVCRRASRARQHPTASGSVAVAIRLQRQLLARQALSRRGAFQKRQAEHYSCTLCDEIVYTGTPIIISSDGHHTATSSPSSGARVSVPIDSSIAVSESLKTDSTSCIERT